MFAVNFHKNVRPIL